MASSLSDSERESVSRLRSPGTRSDPYPPTAAKFSDTDFTDVFGRPWRRSSINELRRSRADFMDSGSPRANGSGYGYGSGSGSGLGERPVFGEIGSPARRRHLKDDFFSDIFRSSEFGVLFAKESGEGFFEFSDPKFAGLEPTRPLPPVRIEAVAGGSSLPAQLRSNSRYP